VGKGLKEDEKGGGWETDNRKDKKEEYE